MAEYGFTTQEIQNYESLKRVYSSYGRDIENDILILCVYSISGQLLSETPLSIDNLDFENDGDFIDLNIGQHLRDLGYTEGEYDVEYKFLRRLAGREQTVLVDDKGLIWYGGVDEKIINGETRYFTNIGDEKDTTQRKELFQRDLTYIISEISPDRTELIVELDKQIKNPAYKNNLKAMGELFEYRPLKEGNAGAIKFDPKSPYELEFDINPKDRGFTQNMVGGEIIIPDVYKVTGFEDTTNADSFDEGDIGNISNEFSDFVNDYENNNDVPDYSTQDLYDILTDDESTELEKFYADQALQSQAQDRNY